MWTCQIWFLGLCCMLAATLERFRTPVWRPIRASIFVALGLSGVVPVIHGLSKYGYETLERKMSLGWVVLQGALYIFGAFLYAVSFSSHLALAVDTYSDLDDSIVGRSGTTRGPSTFLAARTSYSTCACCWRHLASCTAWQRRLTTTILSWLLDVELSLVVFASSSRGTNP